MIENINSLGKFNSLGNVITNSINLMKCERHQQRLNLQDTCMVWYDKLTQFVICMYAVPYRDLCKMPSKYADCKLVREFFTDTSVVTAEDTQSNLSPSHSGTPAPSVSLPPTGMPLYS